jgi:hypothetical protein
MSWGETAILGEPVRVLFCDAGSLSSRDCAVFLRRAPGVPEDWIEVEDPFMRDGDGGRVRLHLCPACQRPINAVNREALLSTEAQRRHEADPRLRDQMPPEHLTEEEKDAGLDGK